MKQACSNEDFDILYKLIASQLNAAGLVHLSSKLIKENEIMPQASHWLMHLVMIGRDALGIAGFNFYDSPVTPHTSFVNSLQPYYNTYSQVEIAELESPVKHNLLGISPDHQNAVTSQLIYEEPSTSFNDLEQDHAPCEISESGVVLVPFMPPSNSDSNFDEKKQEYLPGPDHIIPAEPQMIANAFKPYARDTADNATICVGVMPKASVAEKEPGSLETVIENLNSQLDVINTEIRDEINELSTISPDEAAPEGKSGCSPEATPKEVPSTPLPEIGATSHTVPVEEPAIAPSPQGLTIEELEPIPPERPKRKRRKINKEKESKKLDCVSEGPSAEGPSCSYTDPSQAGETELLSGLQRVLTSNIMSTNSAQPKKSRVPKQSRKKSVPMISLDEQTLIAKMAQDTTQPSIQDCGDTTLNSKLLTELQRLLTQNNIRSALQGEKKNSSRRNNARPSLESPPYIRPPQLHDSASMDGSRFHLDKPKMFPCLQCNKEFKTKQCLKRHISRHLGVKLHACTYCQKRFNDRSNMMRHVVTHLDLRKFVCDVCDQAFFRKEVMEMHKRRKHTIPDDILNCRFKKCDFSCNIPHKLVEHIQTVHFNNFLYNCDKCKYKTQHNYNYIKHLRVHTGERPFKCSKCGRGFKQRNALKTHSLVHLDRPHKCEICLKTFSLELALRIHYENNHGPRAAQKKIHEKKKREILQKYRQQRSVHSKKLSFVNVMPNKI